MEPPAHEAYCSVEFPTGDGGRVRERAAACRPAAAACPSRPNPTTASAARASAADDAGAAS